MLTSHLWKTFIKFIKAPIRSFNVYFENFNDVFNELTGNKWIWWIGWMKKCNKTIDLLQWGCRTIFLLDSKDEIQFFVIDHFAKDMTYWEGAKKYWMTILRYQTKVYVSTCQNNLNNFYYSNRIFNLFILTNFALRLSMKSVSDNDYWLTNH